MSAPIAAPEDFLALVNIGRGPTGWLTIDQAAVNDFARLTGDPQWIHVDPARAALSPFGTTIVHGYLTLSLVGHWLSELYPITEDVISINYGLNRTRFPAPVKVGSRLRMTAVVTRCDLREGGSVLAEIGATIEAEGAPKPACVASAVLLYAPARALPLG